MKLKKKYVNRIKFIILVIVIILLLMFIIKLFKKEHNINYEIDNYNISEKFYIKDKNHYYNFVIKDNKNDYIFSTNKKFNKDKKIIKKIVKESVKKTTCIMPVYKKNINSNILCNYDNNIVSIYYLKTSNENLYNKIVKLYKKDGYKIDNYNNDNVYKYKKLSIYKKNIDNNQTYTLWNYKGLYLVNNKETTYNKLLDEDKYENELAILVGKYYVFIDTNNRYKGFKLYYYDIEKDKLKDFSKTEDKIDDDIYFSGTYNNKLYIYDKHFKKQYIFDPYKAKFKKVGDKVKGFYLVKNNKLELVDYYEFKDIIYFNNKINNEKINKLYNSKEVYLLDNYYYIYSNDGYFYKVDMNNIKRSITLFKLDNISSFIIRDNNIIISKESGLYNYNLDKGLLNIIDYEELNYNYNNIFDLYEKN